MKTLRTTLSKLFNLKILAQIFSSLFPKTDSTYSYTQQVKLLNDSINKKRGSLKIKAFENGLKAPKPDPVTQLLPVEVFTQDVESTAGTLLQKMDADLIEVQSKLNKINDDLKIDLETRIVQIITQMQPRKIVVHPAQIEELNTKVKIKEDDVNSLKANLDTLLEDLERKRPVRSWYYSKVFDISFAGIIILSELSVTLDLFRDMGLGEIVAPLTSIALSGVMALSAILSGQHHAEQTIDKRNRMTIVGFAVIGLIGALRLLDPVHLYMVFFNLIFWVLGFHVSAITTLPKRYFSYRIELEKAELELAILRQDVLNMNHIDAASKEGIDLDFQAQALIKAKEKDQALKSKKSQLEDVMNSIKGQKSDLRNMLDEHKKSGEIEYRDAFKRGFLQKGKEGGGSAGIGTILILGILLSGTGCDLGKHFQTPETVTVEVCLDQTQEPQNKNKIDASAVVKFIFDDLVFPNGYYVTRDKIRVTISPINDVYISTPEVYTLPSAGLNMNKPKRAENIHSFRDKLILRIDVGTSKSFGLKKTRLHQAICSSLKRMFEIDADRRFLVLMTDGLQNDDIVSFHVENPEDIIKDYKKLEEAMMEDCLWPEDLSSLDVYFIYTPNIFNQKNVKVAQDFWTKMFSSRGAKVLPPRGNFLSSTKPF